MYTDENNYLSILHGLGRECIGAIRVTEEGETLDSGYEPVDADNIRRLAEEGSARSTDLVVKAHI